METTTHETKEPVLIACGKTNTAKVQNGPVLLLYCPNIDSRTAFEQLVFFEEFLGVHRKQ
jgi:hypothetical protein